MDQEGADGVLGVYPPDAVSPSGSSVLDPTLARDIAVDSGAKIYMLVGGEIKKYEATEPTATLIATFASPIPRRLQWTAKTIFTLRS